jgi:hypothetical protein
MSGPDDDGDDAAATWVLSRQAVPHQALNTLELRIVLYDQLKLLAASFPQLSHLLPEAKYRKLSKDPKTKRTADWTAFLYLSNVLSGSPVSDDERRLLGLWCARQRGEIRPGRLKPRRRGRPGAWEKQNQVRVAYARKLEEMPHQKKESIIAELAQEYGLKRRRVFEIIKDTDPDLLLRAIRDPDPLGWNSDELF